MSRHTPGPWGWEAHDASMATLAGTLDGSVDSMRAHVMSIGPCRSCAASAIDRGEGWRFGRCTTVNEANARLIAAAPELLEALKEAEGFVHAWAASYASQRGLPVGEMINEHREIANKVHAAIAKAEGEG